MNTHYQGLCAASDGLNQATDAYWATQLQSKHHESSKAAEGVHAAKAAHAEGMLKCRVNAQLILTAFNHGWKVANLVSANSDPVMDPEYAKKLKEVLDVQTKERDAKLAKDNKREDREHADRNREHNNRYKDDRDNYNGRNDRNGYNGRYDKYKNGGNNSGRKRF